MPIKITKLNRVIRDVEENVFRNGDATICKTTAYIYLPYELVDYTNEMKVAEILSDSYRKDEYHPFNVDSVSDKMFKVLPVSQTSYVVKHEDDIDDQHLANVLAKQKAMRKIENRVIKALQFLCDDLWRKRVEIMGVLTVYQNRLKTIK